MDALYHVPRHRQGAPSIRILFGERPSLVGDLYHGLHSFFSALLDGGIFMESLSPDKRALLTEKFHVLLDGSDIVASLETFFLIQR